MEERVIKQVKDITLQSGTVCAEGACTYINSWRATELDRSTQNVTLTVTFEDKTKFDICIALEGPLCYFNNKHNIIKEPNNILITRVDIELTDNFNYIKDICNEYTDALHKSAKLFVHINNNKELMLTFTEDTIYYKYGSRKYELSFEKLVNTLRDKYELNFENKIDIVKYNIIECTLMVHSKLADTTYKYEVLDGQVDFKYLNSDD